MRVGVGCFSDGEPRRQYNPLQPTTTGKAASTAADGGKWTDVTTNTRPVTAAACPDTMQTALVVVLEIDRYKHNVNFGDPKAADIDS